MKSKQNSSRKKYKFNPVKENYEDYSSGRVLYGAPKATNFPVRLASEIFLCCSEHLKKNGSSGPYTIYDPFCGSAYSLTVMGFFHGLKIKDIFASDVNNTILEFAQKNLSLLSEIGLQKRINELEGFMFQILAADPNKILAGSVFALVSIVDGEKDAINPQQEGTKCAAWFSFDEDGGVLPGECAVVRFRFSKKNVTYFDEGEFDDIMDARIADADDFYYRISPLPMSDDLRNIQRQAFSGMMWTKQHYLFIWDQWANGDPTQPPPPPNRKAIRNEQWKHMHCDDILSMPDSWEYPFFAAWDSAFHCITLAMIDPDFAKKQLDLFTREWYCHPNGQLPA